MVSSEKNKRKEAWWPRNSLPVICLFLLLPPILSPFLNSLLAAPL